MRIFVGTLYTIENEIDQCTKSIERQTYENYEHFIFEGLANKEAHSTLYKSFMESSDEFDLMIKVDADMVIEDKYFFSKVVKKFKAEPDLEDLEVAVHDCFSNALIWGLHAYRNTVKWEANSEELYLDKCPVDDQHHLTDTDELAPAALHCPNPTSFQAFHYGVHHGLKSIYPKQEWIEGKNYLQYWYEKIKNKLLESNSKNSGDDAEEEPAPLGHWERMKKIRGKFLEERSKQLAFILLGYELALAGEFQPRHLDNTDPLMQDFFSRYDDEKVKDIEESMRKLRARNFDFLPGKIRKKVLSLLVQLGIRGNIWK